MKAALYPKYGPPEIIRLADIPPPVPIKGEVLIKVFATTVNRTDTGFRSAQYFVSRFFSGLFKPKMPVMGTEFAGKIEALGPDVTRFKIGDRVFGFNDTKMGAHAEYMVLPEKAAMTTMPKNWPYHLAAPLSEGAHYALNYVRATKIGKGTRVLINGATGAIGSAGVQLSKHFGAEITAVCATPHIELIKSLGADVVIDYLKEDFTQLDQTFDVVFDAVGKSTFGKCKRIMKPNGIYVSSELGPRFENPFLALLSPFKKGKRVLFPIPLPRISDIEFLRDLAEQGKFKPVIDRTYPLDEIAEAHRYVEQGEKIGNVIISVREE